MISCVDHLNIVVSDLEKSRSFFEMLGFSEVMTSDLDTAFLEKVTGIQGARGRFSAMRHTDSPMNLELLQYEGAAEAGDPRIGMANRIGFRHLAFRVRNMEGVVERLASHGVAFMSPVQVWEKTGKKLVYFLGPDGILMELCEYPEA